jgi:hypothetical protein
MLELGLDASLVQKPSQEGAIRFVLAANDFHDHGPFGAFDAAGRGKKHLAHAPTREPLEQGVTLEATRQGQVGCSRRSRLGLELSPILQ